MPMSFVDPCTAIELVDVFCTLDGENKINGASKHTIKLYTTTENALDVYIYFNTYAMSH